ncbi:MAG: hypothetical protein C1943_11335 [Halochromatium sp.]|nr:hypothetical protein [Halochromatium sp.]
MDKWQDFGLKGRLVLITGVTGGIGHALARRLLRLGARVRGLTRYPSRAEQLFRDLPIQLCAGDLCKPDSLTAALEGVDTLFHLASYVPPLSCVDRYNAPGHWEVTVTGTQALLDAVAVTGAKRLVYLSSVKAMGDTSGASGVPADETHGCEPKTCYGQAKRAAERIILAAGRASGLHVSVLRIPMVYGIDDTGNIPKMVTAIARRRFPPWPKRHNCRSAIHVDDVITAALLCSASTKADGQIYLATDGNVYSTRWIYEAATRACGRQPPSWGLPAWLLGATAVLGSGIEKATGRGIGLNLETFEKLIADGWYDATKIRNELGFLAAHDLGGEIGRLVDRLRLRVPREQPPEQPELIEYRSLEDYRDRSAASAELISERARLTRNCLVVGQKHFKVRGFCDPCGRDVDFLVDYLGASGADGDQLEPNWRERLLCPCGLNNRVRAALHILNRYCQPPANAVFYLTEQVTPLYRWVAQRFQNTVGSEYLGDQVALGTKTSRGIRNESVMALSFSDATFDYVLSFDVLEHVPNYQKGLSELCRVLKPGGYLVLSVPFVVHHAETIVRARLGQDGSIEHLLPAEYHGDPLTEAGCLCFYHFGWDLLETCRTAGFSEAFAVGLWSRPLGHLGPEQLIFLARK